MIGKPRVGFGEKSHVVVTGGSSGIGKAIAHELIRHGFNITLVARNEKRLQDAKDEIEKSKIFDWQNIVVMSVDVSKEYSQVETAIKQAEEINGPVKMLFNCAGSCTPGRFDELDVSTFKEQIDLNYLGSVYPTRAVIGTMKKERQGIIVFTSSQAGQLGLPGFTAYSSSKFALRGFAESLQLEMKPYNISVSISYPADTDTPGLAKEALLKPPETKAISDGAGLFEVDFVAKRMIADALSGKFTIFMGIDGWMLSMVTAGMGPPSFLFEALQQVIFMGILRLISIFTVFNFNRIIRKQMVEEKKIQ